MLKKVYQNLIREILQKYTSPKAKIFIFGSSIKSRRFKDIDIGIQDSEINESSLRKAKEELEDSILPYKVDIIDFEKVDQDFKKKVFEDQILWLTWKVN